MLTKKIKKSLSGLLAFAMVVTGLSVQAEDVAQAAAKAKLKTKKISIKVGAKKKITIKKKKAKAKYTFSSSKKKVASVSKSGTVKGKKAGKAKITVKEKYKKKVRKLGVVKVTVKKSSQAKESPEVSASAAAPTASSGSVTSKAPVSSPTDKATAKPTGTAPVSAESTGENPASQAPEPTTEIPDELTWEQLNLEEYEDFAAYASSSNCSYENNVLKVTDTEYFGFKLPQDVSAGETVYVHVKGINNGPQGFRSWLVDNNSTTCVGDKDLYFFTQDKNDAFAVGEFDITYALPPNADCGHLFFKGPTYGVNIEDLTLSSVEVALTGEKDTTVFEPTEEQNAAMIQASLTSTGNNARIKSAIERAKAGEDVTIAYIGGSITEGAGASPNSKCNAQLSCTMFAEKYGTGENVHFVNAGMSGTPSSLGIVRYDRDVLGQMTADHPDILFVEFAVNDNGECTSQGAYEGLIRRALESGSAVILLFSVFQSDWNMQKEYTPYGVHYDLPMVSMKDAVDVYFKESGFIKWYFSSDGLHPTNAGHQLTAECIMNLFDTIDKEEAEADNTAEVLAKAPQKTDAYAGTKMMGPETVDALKAEENASLLDFDEGGFNVTDKNTGKFLFNTKAEKFPTNWMHTADSGEASLTAKVNCRNLLVVYKLSNDTKTGKAELYVDGELVKTMDGYNTDGWNNATTELAFNDETAREHTIEVKMAEGDEKKEFTLLAMGYNK